MKQLVRDICLSAAMLTVSSPALADAPNGDITAMGRTELRHDWLSLRGPDPDGTVVARIRTGDLDLTTQSGKAKLDRRIKHAGADLCLATLDDPEMSVAQQAAERDCLRDAKAQASRQLKAPVQAAR